MIFNSSIFICIWLKYDQIGVEFYHKRYILDIHNLIKADGLGILQGHSTLAKSLYETFNWPYKEVPSSKFISWEDTPDGAVVYGFRELAWEDG